jgi:hypothetical protein
VYLRDLGHVLVWPGPRDYTQGTERALYTFSAATCYFTDCQTRVIVFLDGEPVSNVEIAHIRGAVPGSPRYDPTMNDHERRSFANLILLCTPHHKIVDRLHPDDYPVEVLADWKAQHERDSGIDGAVLSPLTEDRLLDLIEKAVASTERQGERQLVFGVLSFLDGRRVLFDPWNSKSPSRSPPPFWRFAVGLMVTLRASSPRPKRSTLYGPFEQLACSISRECLILGLHRGTGLALSMTCGQV